ncbi:MAG: hypothetical protein IH591_06010 [Bacteroidales bacterium]|nr:hypothetical protein [Bacteroidales bacterium]
MTEILRALAPLKNLPDYFKSIRDDLSTGLNRVIQSRAEMEIYIRMAQLGSKKALLGAENEAIHDLKKQIEYDFREIDERYARIQNELNVECRKRIRAIDEHLLRIPENFPGRLYQGFEADVLPLFRDLVSDTRISYEERLKAINVAVNKSTEMLNAFIRIREGFVRNVDGFQFQSTTAGQENYSIPVWLVEIEDSKNHKCYTKAFFPGESIVNPELESGSISYIPDTRVGPYLRFLEDNGFPERLAGSFSWEKGSLNAEEIAKDMGTYLNDKYQGRNSRINGAICKLIMESELKTVKS